MTRTIKGSFLLLMAGLAGCGTEIVGYRATGTTDDGGAVVGTDVGSTPQDGGTTTADGGSAQPDVQVTPIPDSGPPSSCVSGTHWTGGTRGSASMEPGLACINCHVTRRADAPQIIGGTAYNQPNEEDNCNGFRGTNSIAAGGSYIEATDANNYTFRMAINAAGNFYYGGRTAIRFPLHGVASVGPSGMRNEMTSEPPNGDCNSCHTQMGTTTVAGADPAPGRIVVTP